MGKAPAAVPGLAEASKILDRFLADPSLVAFFEPVAWKEYGLDDYLKVVKEPMDLGTIKKNLAKNKYTDLKEFVRHMKLVWKNCMAYNADGSDLHKLARKFDKRFDREMARVQKKVGGGGGGGGRVSLGGSNRGPTAEEKATFCKVIYDLSEVNLGQLIKSIDETCEDALEKRGTEEIEVDVDKMDLANFRKLNALAKTLLDSQKQQKPAATTKPATGVKSETAGPNPAVTATTTTTTTATAPTATSSAPAPATTKRPASGDPACDSSPSGSAAAPASKKSKPDA